MDYKDWIQNRAEELAEEQYDRDFYDLPDNLQIEVWNRAEADYHDHEADKIDAAYDRAIERNMSKRIPGEVRCPRCSGECSLTSYSRLAVCQKCGLRFDY